MAYNDKPNLSFAFASSASAGDQTLAAAVAGVRYRVLGVHGGSSAGQTMTFKSGTTEISGAFVISANKQVLMPMSKDMAWCQTAVGEALVVNFASATAGTSIHVVYEVTN